MSGAKIVSVFSNSANSSRIRCWKVLFINVPSKHCYLSNQFTVISKIKHYKLLLYQLKLTTARLKKSTAQWSRLANSARIFINLSWYDYNCGGQTFLRVVKIDLAHLLTLLLGLHSLTYTKKMSGLQAREHITETTHIGYYKILLKTMSTN